MHGCTNSTEWDPDDDGSIQPTIDNEIIVVRRQTQTVRAIEPRTGGERWNFSVGQHELELVRSPDDCHSSVASDPVTLDYELKFIVPEGVVFAVRKETPHIIEWKQKLDFPIANAWTRDENQQLKSIDLFATAQTMWQQSERYKPMPDDTVDGTMDRLVPSIYIGMHNKQLYIQESERMRLEQANLFSHLIESEKKSIDRIPWRPVEASSISIDNGQANNALVPSKPDGTGIVALPNHQETAIAVLYGSEYVNGNGFYLFTRSNQLNASNGDGKDSICNKDNETTGKEITELDGDEDTMPPINIVSLWYWWKEIMVISLTTALALNALLSQRKMNEPEVVIVERHVEIKVPSTPDGSDDVPSITSKRTNSESYTTGGDGDNSDGGYKSRFQADFDMVHRLGKGGYGVVFEVKNKLDGCHYAIKRIAMPKSQTKHDAVIREVKTLATCDHQNIVRYFNSWVEKPPPGWQEREDRLWMEREALSHSISIDSVTTGDTSHHVHVHSKSVANNKLDSVISNLKTNECVNFDDELRKTNFRNQFAAESNEDDDDDSFIQFERLGAEDPIVWDTNGGHDSDDEDDGDNDDESHPAFSDRSKTDTECSKRIAAQRRNEVWKKIDNGSATSGVCSGALKPTHRRPMSLDLNAPVPRWYLYIQMQLCRKESLKDWLQKSDTTVRANKTSTIFKQIVQAVEYVHLKGLIHRDLKPGNIFFALDGQIKIGDFGLVTDMLDDRKVQTPCGDETGLPTCNQHTEQVGTHLYMSPEQLSGGPYNYKVDIYSLGLILFELLVVFSTEMERIETLRALRSSKFPDGFQQNQKQEVRQCHFFASRAHIYCDFLGFYFQYDLLKLMLSKTPEERPTTYGIRSHPPFSDPTDKSYHFELPPRRRGSQNFSNI